MSRYVCWCCEYDRNSGEGQLARIFLNYFENKDVKVITPKLKFYLSEYFYQLFGILVIWYYYLRRKKVIYLNYLPLWNSLIFLLSPPNTIFGPITGSIQINKIQNFYSFVRAKVMPLLYHFSLKILDFRLKKIIFATNILNKFINNKIKKKSVINFIPNNYKIKINKKKFTRKFDIVVYYRNHQNKFYEHHLNFIKEQINLKKKIIIVGDKIKINGSVHLGRLKKNELMKILKKSKFCLSGDDNLMSLFNLECIKSGVKIIYNHKLKFQIINKKTNLFRAYNFEKKKFAN